MKTKEELLKELENIGVFEFKNDEYLCTGYYIDVTEEFVKLHKYLRKHLQDEYDSFEYDNPHDFGCPCCRDNDI